jgi:pyruvate/2-oxoglutarate dehydrogenase complex dihydrolipoamide acyltransferase (E2) component
MERGPPRLPAGIVKTNGRIEATQVDVSAKYAGRLATVAVNEGDEVMAGQVLARISSPEYEAQLRGARSQVLKAKQALVEAEALIAHPNSGRLRSCAVFRSGRPEGSELGTRGPQKTFLWRPLCVPLSYKGAGTPVASGKGTTAAGFSFWVAYW